MFGLQLWRSKLSVIGAPITVWALLFVTHTASETIRGLLPIAVAIVFAGRFFGFRIWPSGSRHLSVPSPVCT